MPESGGEFRQEPEQTPTSASQVFVESWRPWAALGTTINAGIFGSVASNLFASGRPVAGIAFAVGSVVSGFSAVATSMAIIGDRKR